GRPPERGADGAGALRHRARAARRSGARPRRRDARPAGAERPRRGPRAGARGPGPAPGRPRRRHRAGPDGGDADRSGRPRAAVAGSRGAASSRRAGHRAMTVVELLGALEHPALLSAPPAVPASVASVAVTGVVHDSQRAKPGTVFVGVKGTRTDGTDFAP